MHGAGPTMQGGSFSVSRRVWIFGVISTVMALLMASVTVAFAAQGGGDKGRERTTICHKGHTLTVAAPALPAHERHGDVEGACADDEGIDDGTAENRDPAISAGSLILTVSLRGG